MNPAKLEAEFGVYMPSLKAYLFRLTANREDTEDLWSVIKSAVVFGTLTGFFWDGLQGGIIEVATFKMPASVFWVDSTYHTMEGILMALIISFFYNKYVNKRKSGQCFC